VALRLAAISAGYHKCRKTYISALRIPQLLVLQIYDWIFGATSRDLPGVSISNWRWRFALIFESWRE
jgi:hypothetical protein